MNELPEGATAIDIDRLFAAIGELYFQVRELRAIVARQHQAAAPSPSNGTVEAVHDPR